jgi:hypothetical protein
LLIENSAALFSFIFKKASDWESHKSACVPNSAALFASPLCVSIETPSITYSALRNSLLHFLL